MLLETATVKLASVAQRRLRRVRPAMLRALIAGEASPAAMADLAEGQWRRKRADLTIGIETDCRPLHSFTQSDL